MCGCGADINDVDKRNENWAYWIDAKTGEASWIAISDQMTVKDGKFTSFYNKGAIYEKGKLINGKHVDTIYCYDMNENLIKYKLVKPDTLLHYYIKDGPYTSYFQDGKIFEKGIIKNHRHWGEWTKYYKNGNIEFIEKVKNKTGLTIWYHDNGQISDSCYHINGKANGLVKIWFESGQIKEICNWKNGEQNGSFEAYFENGNLNEKGNWINGKNNGKHESWYENGQKEQVQFFKAGIHDGIVLQWYSNGNKKAIVNFISGKVDGKVINYYENGKVKSQGYFKDGKRNGTLSWYNENGKLTKEQIFADNELVSVEK
jgi:antitoxin component YwqK of YwqJK toxin-antitoxin module